MLLPYKDINPVKRKSYITWVLIIINISFFLTYGLPSLNTNYLFDNMEIAWKNWGLFANPISRLDVWPEIITHMFLHGGWIHLLINMLMLYIFGNNLEDILGHIRFLVYYLTCGIAGGVVYALTESDPSIPAGGASGAIAGLMGGYLLLFPRAKIMSVLILPNLLWPFSILIRLFWKLQIWGYWPLLFLTFSIPAWAYLGFWAGWNIWGAYWASNFSNIAYTIHLGGFIAGIALIILPPFSGPKKLAKSLHSIKFENYPSTIPAIKTQKPPGPWDKPVSTKLVPKSKKPIELRLNNQDQIDQSGLVSTEFELPVNDQADSSPPSSRQRFHTYKSTVKKPINLPPVKRKR